MRSRASGSALPRPAGGADTQPNATYFSHYRECCGSLWGRPPGLRGTPSSRIWNNGVSVLQGATGRPGGRPRGVPSMGSVLLDERSQSGPMTATVAKPQGATARGKPKEAGGKLSTVGTRTGSEAGCGRQAGPEQRSPKVIKTHQVEPDGAREQSLHLTWGDLLGESRGEVSRGRMSEEAA